MEEQYDVVKEMIRQAEESKKLKYESMVTKKDWGEFRKTGLLLFINNILHVFGWSIVFEVDQETDEIKSVYPARVKFRGFNSESVAESHIQIADYLYNNIEELNKEATS